MKQQTGDDPRSPDRRWFLKRAALGVADALETAARFAGAPGLGSPAAARKRERLDQPEDGLGDPMFTPARRRDKLQGEKRGSGQAGKSGESS